MKALFLRKVLFMRLTQYPYKLCAHLSDLELITSRKIGSRHFISSWRQSNSKKKIMVIKRERKIIEYNNSWASSMLSIELVFPFRWSCIWQPNAVPLSTSVCSTFLSALLYFNFHDFFRGIQGLTGYEVLKQFNSVPKCIKCGSSFELIPFPSQ